MDVAFLALIVGLALLSGGLIWLCTAVRGDSP